MARRGGGVAVFRCGTPDDQFGDSAGSALWMGAVVNRMLKISDGKEVRGIWATPAQDNLRAAVLFAGAGLDRAMSASESFSGLCGSDGRLARPGNSRLDSEDPCPIG